MEEINASRRAVFAYGSVTSSDIATLIDLGQRLAAATANDTSAVVDKIAMRAKPADSAGSTEVVAYALAQPSVGLVNACSSVLVLSEAEEDALRRLKCIESQFAWEDKQRSPNDRGIALAMLSAIPFDSDRASRMRDLLAQFDSSRVDGLADRARAIGYYREAMALTANDRGDPVFLIYLEVANPSFEEALRAFPDTEFTLWWNPQFGALTHGNPFSGQGDIILDWERPS